MNFGLEGRVALITGGSKGIGKAVAQSLIAEGVNVSICARNHDILRQTAAELTAMGRSKVLALPADMESPDDIRRLVQRTVDEFGRIDLFVNNAGPGQYRVTSCRSPMRPGSGPLTPAFLAMSEWYTRLYQ